MRVHLGETEIGNGRGLKRLQDTLPSHPPGTKIFQQLAGFGVCHLEMMTGIDCPVTKNLFYVTAQFGPYSPERFSYKETGAWRSRRFTAPKDASNGFKLDAPFSSQAEAA